MRKWASDTHTHTHTPKQSTVTRAHRVLIKVIHKYEWRQDWDTQHYQQWYIGVSHICVPISLLFILCKNSFQISLVIRVSVFYWQ